VAFRANGAHNFNQELELAMNAVTRSASSTSDFYVADLSLADWGRKEILIAETEMPGLMALLRNMRRSSRCAVRAWPGRCT